MLNISAMRYFAMIDGRQAGPFTLEELEKAGVGPDTYVWCKGMENWRPAGEVADICRHFRRELHDRMHPQPQALPTADTAPQPDSYEEIPLRWRGAVMRHGGPAQMMPEEKPDLSKAPSTWIAAAIAVIFLCCPVTGFVALFYGIRTRTLWKEGRAQEAYAASARARLWVLISIVVGCFIVAISLGVLS